MKSLVEYINEWKEDLGNQIIMIMGTPGCGKTYWMEHNGIKFFKTQGIKINPRELDIDHTLKYFQLLDFPKFCYRVVNFRSSTLSDFNDKQPHSMKKVWNLFITKELDRYTELNVINNGLETNIPKLEEIEYNFVAPWLSRYDNAKEDKKKDVLKEFTNAMYKEYFNKVFASDFSVRGEAKAEYDINLRKKLNADTDAFLAISGAKMNHIVDIADICKEKGMTCRIVFLNGSLEKAIGQDAKRERSGGAAFVTDYAEKIQNVWKELIDPSSENYFKKLGIYNIYEFEDEDVEDVDSWPKWKLKKTYSSHK
jgi:hypothetical protein